MPRAKVPPRRRAHELAGTHADADGSSPWCWLWLAIITPLLCFLVTLVTLASWSANLHEVARSISTNGSPSVAYLATALDDARRIERRAVLARPATLAVDRGVIEELKEELNRVVAAELRTPDYPGEQDASRVMLEHREAFFAAVDAALGGEAGEHAAAAQARERVTRAGDAFFAAIRAVLDINEREVEAAGLRIAELRGRGNLRDVVMLICVLASTLVGFGGARRYFLVEKRLRRLDAQRATELDIFAGRVAHDLRSPLQAIQMRAWMGARAQALEDAREAHAQVARQTARMSGIIDALLAFARAAALPDPHARSDVGAVMAEVVTEAQLPAEEAHIEIAVELDRAATVACDPSVLAVILSNLVRNAIKYLGDGSQGVRRITLRESLLNGCVRLEVEDTGPGLPPGTEARVFDPFVRVAERASDGIGLGLATVKRLVEANRGSVGVESRPGHGCRFWFTLPLSA